MCYAAVYFTEIAVKNIFTYLSFNFPLITCNINITEYKNYKSFTLIILYYINNYFRELFFYLKK